MNSFINYAKKEQSLSSEAVEKFLNSPCASACALDDLVSCFMFFSFCNQYMHDYVITHS